MQKIKAAAPKSDAHARFIEALRQGADSLKADRVVTKDEMRRRIDAEFAKAAAKPPKKSAAR
jgi:molybdenum cofactor biosynthesis enzyme MoaA